MGEESEKAPSPVDLVAAAPPSENEKAGEATDQEERASSAPPPDASSVAAQSSPGEDEVTAKHPLESAWTLWFDNPNGRSKGQWGNSIRKVYTFSTVEDFWCVYNHFVVPSKLPVGADFHCFKDGIEPKWEDPKCAGGGKWTVSISRKGDTDRLWLHTVLGMIGEQFEEGNEVCGAVVSVRAKADRVAVWTRHANNEDLQVSLGKQLKELLDLTEQIGFVAHEDASNERGKPKERFYA